MGNNLRIDKGAHKLRYVAGRDTRLPVYNSIRSAVGNYIQT